MSWFDKHLNFEKDAIIEDAFDILHSWKHKVTIQDG